MAYFVKMYTVSRLSSGLLLFVASSCGVYGTTIPRVTFEQLTDSSDLISAGHITQTWCAWDSDHKYIWTHYLLQVSETVKGAQVPAIEFAEPGGVAGNSSMVVAGSVRYGLGDSVLVFLSRMPNGYLRTTGWSQGRYRLDVTGRLHGEMLKTDVVDTNTVPSGSSLNTLEGMNLGELTLRVAARLRAAPRRAQ